MAFTLTYATLTDSVKAYLERDDTHLVDEIPLFIMLGQRRICRDLKILGQKVLISGTVTISQPVIQKAAQWLNNAYCLMSPLATPTQPVHLLERSYEFCRQYWPDATAVGFPKYYCDRDFQNWYLAPTPDHNYAYEIGYFETPTLIDETHDTNWLTQNAPEIVLYATLLETAPYLKDDDRVPVWKTAYDQAKEALQKEDQLRIMDNFSLRGL